MRFGFLACLFVLASPAFACDGEGTLAALMVAPLPQKADASFDVTEVGSTEGGNWDVYFDPDGKTVRDLVRIDYGESGRLETRLSVVSPELYGVAATTFHYAAPNYAAGSMVIRAEKDIFVYCAGKVLLPQEDFILPPDYAGKADAARKTFDAAEVAKYVAGLRR